MRTIIRNNYTPEPGDYHERIVIDEELGKRWLFDCDGVFMPFNEVNVVNEFGYSTTDAISQKLFTNTVDDINGDILGEREARINADGVLQAEIDAIKNSPDVVDIVATYADLQAYDTSSLGTDDIVRVLRDEMHDGASTYYRWNDPNAGWNFIGTVGDYYTISQVDTLLAGKQDTLTAGANISIDSNNVISATDTTYTAGAGLNLAGTTFSVDTTTIQEKLTAGTNVSITGNTISATDTTYTAGTNVSISSDNVISATDTTYSDFVGTDGTVAGSAGLVPAPAITDAGKFLKADGTWDTAGGGGVIELTSADYNWPTSNPDGVALWLLEPGIYQSAMGTKIYTRLNNFVNDGRSFVITKDADGDFTTVLQLVEDTIYYGVLIPTGAAYLNYSTLIPPTVVQTTGTSTTNVMSQNATTSMVYKDPSVRNQIQIGNSAQAGDGTNISIGVAASCDGSLTNGNIAIGRNSTCANRSSDIAIGDGAYSTATSGVAIGPRSKITNGTDNYSVALGAGAKTSTKGELNIGTSNISNTAGYNDTAYRLISDVYDGQSAHDAATYGQVISYSAINGAGAPTTATEGKYVGQLYYDTTNEQMYYLKTIDTTTTPATYTWEALGGGSSVNVVQTTGTSTTDVMSQNATTSMVYADPSTMKKIVLGAGASSSNSESVAIAGNISNGNTSIAIGSGTSRASVGNNGSSIGSIAIGPSATTSGAYSVVIGSNAYNQNKSYNTAIGANSYMPNTAQYSVALGSYAKPTEKGQVDISTLASTNTFGYNNSQYRLLTGLYDPQSDHDAATKGYVDTAIAGAGGGAIELTSADYNYPADNPTSVALWMLEPGFYVWKSGVSVRPTNVSVISTVDSAAIVGGTNPNYGKTVIHLFPGSNGVNGDEWSFVSYRVNPSNGSALTTFQATRVINGLNSTIVTASLSAAQGKVLNDKIGGDLSNLTTTDKTSLINAINEVAAGGGGGGPTVVQTTGTSTTDVMSQNATTSMIFADPSTRVKVQIGAAASVTSGANNGVAIGSGQVSATAGGIAIGNAWNSAQVSGNGAIAIGSTTGANVSGQGSISLGAFTPPNTTAGVIEVGSTQTAYGYNSSNYRLLTGLYDPQSAHDAATKGYVDTAVASAGANTISSQDWSDLWQ